MESLVPFVLLSFLANLTTARRMVGYWHNTVIRLSVCPSVCDAVGWISNCVMLNVDM